MQEYWHSSLLACERYLNSPNITIDQKLYQGVPNSFKEIRPWVKYGWEMILIVHEIIKTENPLKSDNKNDFINNYHQNCQRILNENSWIAEDIQKMLDKSRNYQIDKDFKSWVNLHKPKSFNPKKFTIKKKLNSSELKKMLGNNYTNPKVNLDIDFSVSKGGYRLRPHRDDITRLYNFLIYLTDIPKKNGGSLTIYRKKAKKNLRKSFRRFPKITELEVVKSFTPKKGTVVFFQSTPNSYHGVKRFIERNCPKRFFIYGSYALNKPVIWNYKGISYYPHIVSNKKRMLTSFHDANYLTTPPNH